MYKSLRLITFDVTNTLISVARDIGSEYAKVATIYGVKGLDDQERIRRISEAFRVNFKRYDHELPNFGLQAGISSVEWWSRLLVSTFEDAGFSDPTEKRKLQNTAAHLYKLYSRGSQWKVKEHAHDLLFDLRKYKPHISLGILSNFDERLDSTLRDLELTHFFKYIFASRAIGLAKPNPDLLKYVFTKAEIQNPSEEYLHIGDSLELDYRPVIAAGGNAILINAKGHQGLENVNPAHVVTNLKDIRKILNLSSS